MNRKRKKRRKYITFKQILPNMITSGNILTGVLSLVLAWHGHILPAAWLVPVAGIFDFMDGKVARALGGSSSFGV
ncbi:MAG TPA: CDP-alcohol phosphatidyltransferase family protein, partial [Thermosynergistes sp.]|nr:CDP-alcohol phosphatidyltransferase family protein [Thermosynergistes sp.]